MEEIKAKEELSELFGSSSEFLSSNGFTQQELTEELGSLKHADVIMAVLRIVTRATGRTLGWTDTACAVANFAHCMYGLKHE